MVTSGKSNSVSGAGIVVTENDIERYKADLITAGSLLLANYVSDDSTEADRGLVLDKLSVIDLDHDGQPEVSATLKKTIRKKVNALLRTDGTDEYSNDTAYLNLWVTYKDGSPQVILSRVSYEREASWGSGADLVGTLDVDGDGIEEVILRVSGWEVVEFEIYAYRDSKLVRIFHGAGFGC
jgi:hypothetical protein